MALIARNPSNDTVDVDIVWLRLRSWNVKSETCTPLFAPFQNWAGALHTRNSDRDARLFHPFSSTCCQLVILATSAWSRRRCSRCDIMW